MLFVLFRCGLYVYFQGVLYLLYGALGIFILSIGWDGMTESTFLYKTYCLSSWSFRLGAQILDFGKPLGSQRLPKWQPKAPKWRQKQDKRVWSSRNLPLACVGLLWGVIL